MGDSRTTNDKTDPRYVLGESPPRVDSGPDQLEMGPWPFALLVGLFSSLAVPEDLEGTGFLLGFVFAAVLWTFAVALGTRETSEVRNARADLEVARLYEQKVIIETRVYQLRRLKGEGSYGSDF